MPMVLPVFLATSRCICFKTNHLHFLPFSRKCWPDNAASKPLGPRHPAARPMRCDTLSLTRVTPLWRILAPRLLTGDPLALRGATSEPHSHLGASPVPPAQGCRSGSFGGSIFGSPGFAAVTGSVSLSGRREGAGVGERGRFGWKAVRFRSLSSGCCVFWQKSKKCRFVATPC